MAAWGLRGPFVWAPLANFCPASHPARRLGRGRHRRHMGYLPKDALRLSKGTYILGPRTEGSERAQELQLAGGMGGEIRPHREREGGPLTKGSPLGPRWCRNIEGGAGAAVDSGPTVPLHSPIGRVPNTVAPA